MHPGTTVNYRELFPNNEVTLILDRVQTQALLIAKELREYRRSPLFLEGRETGSNLNT
jgi:hypothetical protein